MEQLEGSFLDDCRPRSAPKPTNFTQIPKVTQVPEVSLVFSPTWTSKGDRNSHKEPIASSGNINHYNRDYPPRYNGSLPSGKTNGWSAHEMNSKVLTQDVKKREQVNFLSVCHSSNSKYSSKVSEVRTVVSDSTTSAPNSQEKLAWNAHHLPHNIYGQISGNYITRANTNINISQCSLPKEPPKPASPLAAEVLQNGPLFNVSVPSSYSCHSDNTLENLEDSAHHTLLMQQINHVRPVVEYEGRCSDRRKLDHRSVQTEAIHSPRSKEGSREKTTTGQQTEKSEAVSEELKELLAMNQKQCSVLHSLLQQVVTLQVDQMKILAQMDERLANIACQSCKNAVPENKPTSQCEDVSTQTSLIGETRPCQCPERRQGQNSLPRNDNDVPVVRREEESMGENMSAVCEEELTLHGIRVSTVIEPPPSPGPPMSLHLNEYDLSSCESFTECDAREPPHHPSPIGMQSENKTSWTLYNNIVGHVQRFLHSPEEECEPNVQKKPSVEAIRFATLERIRQLEVSLYENSTEIKEVSTRRRVQFGARPQHSVSFAASEKSRTDSSLEVRTLAMKYLQDDELCELARETGRKVTHAFVKDSSKSPNLSLATRRYLEKYHLLPPGTAPVEYNHSVYRDRKQMHDCAGLVNDDKILDVTTLKRQPKLL